ncbi:Na(+)/H(+) antiporter NhaB [compost metagenome]
MMIYVSNGLLSAVSDNVFVATIYVSQSHQLLEAGLITREVFDAQAVAITMGTGIPAMATPNGQAAFLFLLTSALAAQLRLSYGRMVWMALPYTITTSLAALASIWLFL